MKKTRTKRSVIQEEKALKKMVAEGYDDFWKRRGVPSPPASYNYQHPRKKSKPGARII